MEAIKRNVPLVGKKALVVIALAITFSAIIPQKGAQAWSNAYSPTQDCGQYTSELYAFDAYYTAFKNNGILTFEEVMRASIDHPTVSTSDFYEFDVNDPTQSLILFGIWTPDSVDPLSGESSYYIAWEKHPTEQITVSNNTITIPTGYYGGAVQNDGAAGWHVQVINSTNSYAGQTLDSQYDATCVHKAENLAYSGDYLDTKPVYESYEDRLFGDLACDTLDLVCHFGKITRGIADTFAGLLEGILNGLAFLFVPSGDDIADVFDSIGDALTSQLGFIIYPLTWVIGTATDMASVGATTGGINFGNVFGTNFTVDFQQPLSNLGWLSTLVVWTKASIMMSLMFVLWHKYKEIVTS